MIGEWRKRRKLHRLEGRGDVVARWSEEAQALLDLGGDLIPGPEREIPRDLYGLLVYAWAARADRAAVFHAREVLARVRAQAWRGYTDMPALLEEVRTDLPRGGTGQRMIAFFEELAEKRSTYLFLPVVSRIDRHQGGEGPLPPGALKVDGLADRQADTASSRMVRGMFSGGPENARDRDVFLLALRVGLWDKGPWKSETMALLEMMRGGLRRLYDDPAAALAQVQSDRIPGGSYAVPATEIVMAAQEIADRAPWLWLEVLFVVENALAGPRWFEHAFEVRVIPSADML